MKRALACALLVACADPRFVPLSRTLPPWQDHAQVTTYTLANGMRIALLRDPVARVATIDLRLEVGTGDDPAGHSGLAADLAYLVTATPQQALGTQLAVDADRTEIVSTTLTLPDAIEVEAHRLELSCDELVAPGIAAAHAAAIVQARPTTLAAAIWGAGSPYAHEGIDPRVAPPSPEDVCAFYQQHYVAAAATLVITGPIDGALLSRIRSRFERIPARAPAARPIAAAIEPGHISVHVAGLAHAAVVLIVPAPLPGAPDEVLSELAVRRIASWSNDLHVFLTGGRRARALVIALEDPLGDVVNADPLSRLAKTREKIDEILERADKLYEDDADDRTSEDFLGEQLRVEDVVARTIALAEDVAAHRTVDRLRRLRAWREAYGLRVWIRDHVKDAKPRVLYLLPEGLLPDGAAAGTLEMLGTPPAFAEVDRPATTTAYAPLAAAQPVESWTLPTGLHVVLAPMPGTATVDARLILPVGTRHEPSPGLAQRAAAELMPAQSSNADGKFSGNLVWYADQRPRSEVAVTEITTRFRYAGASGLADWHVFMLSWLMTTGSYSSDASTLAPMRRLYGPRDATLIVTGAFDPARMHKNITTWFSPWNGGDAIPQPARRSDTEALAIADAGERVDLAIVYGDLAGPPAALRMLARLVEERLTTALQRLGGVQVSYDGRGSHQLLVRADLDPGSTGMAGDAMARALGTLCTTGPAAGELDYMRAHTLAELLEGFSTPAGRAHQLEEAAGSPTELETEIAALPALGEEAILRECATLERAGGRRVVARGPRGSLSVLLSALGVDSRRTLFTSADR